MTLLNTLAGIFAAQIKETGPINNVAELMMAGGYIMIPIVVLSFISVYFFIERFSFIRKSSVIDEKLVDNVVRELRNKRPAEALIHTRYNNTALGRILESGLSQSAKPAKDIEGYMESAANIEISVMEKNTGYLGIIAGIAPMLGFIGTISGVIKIFYNIYNQIPQKRNIIKSLFRHFF